MQARHHTCPRQLSTYAPQLLRDTGSPAVAGLLTHRLVGCILAEAHRVAQALDVLQARDDGATLGGGVLQRIDADEVLEELFEGMIADALGETGGGSHDDQ